MPGPLRPLDMWPQTPRPFFPALARLAGGWVTRSLAVGAVATAVDVGVLLLCKRFLGFSNPLAAAVGVAVGSTVAFLGNRWFAFQDAEKEIRPQIIRFVATTSVGMVAHASLVHVLADLFFVPVVLAKMIADLAVFGLGQLFLLRYVVFPRARERDTAVPAARLERTRTVTDSAARAA